MSEPLFPSLSKAVCRLACFVTMALMLGEPLSHTTVATPQRQQLTRDQVLRQIRRAHILSTIPKNALQSFLFSGCMRIEESVAPKTTPKSDLNCIREETGVLQPSHTYVSVAIGKNRVTDLVDSEQGKGWQIVDPVNFSANSSRTMSALHPLKYDALVENARHSLPALLALLQNSDNTQVEVSSDAEEIVLKWRSEGSLNEFYFNRTTFLCEKQVRTKGTAKSIMKYSNYKRVGNVMLPIPS